MRQFSNTKATATGLALTLALSLAAMPTGAVSADGLSFMVFGDAPYGDKQIDLLDDTVAQAIQDENATYPFLIHLGDMKGGGESCTDELIEERYEQLMALHPGRVFYTPGDNEWTDCDRPKLKQRFSEVFRLDFLRHLIVSSRPNLPADWRYATQPDFPENARWMQDNVIFATVHMVSTNNGREEILLDDIESTLDLVDARDQANLFWLKAAFKAARQSGAGAVVIATQADVTKLVGGDPCDNDWSRDWCIDKDPKAALPALIRLAGSAPCSDAVRIRCDAFAVFRDQLLRLAAGFKKPVLLVHGDTTPFCLDKKFGGETAPKLWRLNAFGDNFDKPPNPPKVDATVITVNLDDPAQPFEIRRLMTGKLLRKQCS